MKLNYSYCLNQDTCIHRRGCKIWIGNYTDEEAIFVAHNVFDYADDKNCMKELYVDLDRFRLSRGEYLK